MTNKKVVYAIGGSIVQENLENLGELVEALESDKQVIIVTGAGKLNRYQGVVDGNNGEKDLIGIKATRLHAQTVLTQMDDVYPSVPETPEELKEAASTGKNVVMGGLVPGYSTDAVAATAAELLDAELFIATTVDGIYDKDPDEDSNAKRYSEISTGDLQEVVGGKNEPGTYSVVDEAAVRLIERSSIKTRVFEATLENLSNPESAKSTEIIPEDSS